MDSGTRDGRRQFKSAGVARPRKLTLLVLKMQHAHEPSVNTSAAAAQQWDNKLTCVVQ